MDDATLFGIGCGVTAIGFGGAYVYLRARFEALWIEEGEQPDAATLAPAEQRAARPREEHPPPPAAPPPPA